MRDIETNTDTPACWSVSSACQRVIGGGAFGSIALTSVASKEGIDEPTVILSAAAWKRSRSRVTAGNVVRDEFGDSAAGKL